MELKIKVDSVFIIYNYIINMVRLDCTACPYHGAGASSSPISPSSTSILSSFSSVCYGHRNNKIHPHISNYTEAFNSQYHVCTRYLLAKSAFLFIFVEHCYIVQVKLALQIETWRKQKKKQRHPQREDSLIVHFEHAKVIQMMEIYYFCK